MKTGFILQLILHCRSIRFLFHTHLFTYFHETLKKLFSDLYPSKSNSFKIVWNWPVDSEEACMHREHSYHEVTLNMTSNTLLPSFVLPWKYTQYSLSINHIWMWDREYSVYLQSITLGASLWALKITEVKAHVVYKIHRSRYGGMKINMYYNACVHNNL